MSCDSCEPTGLIFLSSKALRSLTCSDNGISPTSSRKSVPPCAAEKSPRRSATAPVKEPFLCPKSSDSSSPSGIAPQFTATNGAPERGLARWMARARSSFPVPDCPKMHTLASDAATRRACASRSSMLEERVMSSERQLSISPAGGLDRRIASATVSSSTFGSKGLVRNEKTPRRVAVTASGIVPCAVRISTGSEGESRWIASNSAIPSMPCMRRSVTTTCGRDTASAASAASPDPTAVTAYPAAATRPTPSMPPRRRPGPPAALRDTASPASAASPDATAVTAYPAAVSRIAINCSRSLSSSTSRTVDASRVISSPLPAPQLLLALEDTPLDRSQGLELLAQGLLALVALLVRALALPLHPLALARGPLCLAGHALELPGTALALRDLGAQPRREPPDARRVRVRQRPEKLRRAGVVAKRRRQCGQQHREPQAAERRRLCGVALLRALQRGLLLRCRRPCRADGFSDDGIDRPVRIADRLQLRAARKRRKHQRDERPHAGTAARRGLLRGSVTRKCPPPSSGRTRMRPPCASANSLAMARPSPLPAIGPLAFARPRKKELKVESCSSSGTPGPLSMTSISASSPLERSTTEISPPAGVNFTALPIRLSRMERSFSGSASTLTRARSWPMRCPLACIDSPCDPCTSRTSDSSATGRGSSEAAVWSARW